MNKPAQIAVKGWMIMLKKQEAGAMNAMTIAPIDQY